MTPIGCSVAILLFVVQLFVLPVFVIKWLLVRLDKTEGKRKGAVVKYYFIWLAYLSLLTLSAWIVSGNLI